MTLNARGGIALGEAIVYIPILVISAILALRHGFKRRAGWIFLVILSIVRIVGGIVHVVAEVQSNPSSTVVTIYVILESAGLSPLMMATLGFLGTVCQSVSQTPDIHKLIRGLQLMSLLNTVALILAIVGGVDLGNAKTQSDLNSASTKRHVGVILFLVLAILIALVHGFLWTRQHELMRYRRTLLKGISAALPFLFIRTLYSVLSGFSPASVPGTPIAQNSLSKFSSTKGSWEIYLFMSVLVELIVVITYIVVGTKVPLDKDFKQASSGSIEGGEAGYQYQSDQTAPSSYPPSRYLPDYRGRT